MTNPSVIGCAACDGTGKGPGWKNDGAHLCPDCGGTGVAFRKLPFPVYCESGVKSGRRQGCQCIPDEDPCAQCVEFARKLEELRASGEA